MSFHDAYLRLTPYELAFPGAAEGGDETPEAATRLQDLGALAFHAVPFRRAGCPLLLLDVALCRALAGGWPPEGAPALMGTVAAPGPAGYAQLPRHLFWTEAVPGQPPEPVDGFFWTVGTGEVLYLMLVSGVREGRPGLSVVPVVDAPLSEAGAWLTARVREEGDDFATTLPGGELQGLYSLVASGEVLKLAARLFAHLAAVPEAAHPGLAGPEGATPAPSRLPYRRITTSGGG